MSKPKRVFRFEKVDITDVLVQQLISEMHIEAFGDKRPHIVTSGLWWIVFCGTDPAAFCGVESSYRWADTAYLCRAAVLSKYRGYGLQKRMIRVRVKHAKKLGNKFILTDTIENCHSSNNLTECGFRMYQPRFPWGNPGSLYWRKFLK